VASHARDGAEEVALMSTAKPEDKRIPLSEVMFREPTKLRGLSWMVTSLEAGTTRLVDGKEWSPPPMWLDKELRVIKIDGASYPLERVHYYIQAPAALSKKAKPLDLEAFTVGKRARKPA
jgi:hypothetical protein